MFMPSGVVAAAGLRKQEAVLVAGVSGQTIGYSRGGIGSLTPDTFSGIDVLEFYTGNILFDGERYLTFTLDVGAPYDGKTHSINFLSDILITGVFSDSPTPKTIRLQPETEPALGLGCNRTFIATNPRSLRWYRRRSATGQEFVPGNTYEIVYEEKGKLPEDQYLLNTGTAGSGNGYDAKLTIKQGSINDSTFNEYKGRELVRVVTNSSDNGRVDLQITGLIADIDNDAFFRVLRLRGDPLGLGTNTIDTEETLVRDKAAVSQDGDEVQWRWTDIPFAADGGFNSNRFQGYDIWILE